MPPANASPYAHPATVTSGEALAVCSTGCTPAPGTAFEVGRGDLDRAPFRAMEGRGGAKLSKRHQYRPVHKNIGTNI
jgi:hypothetical protein